MNIAGFNVNGTVLNIATFVFEKLVYAGFLGVALLWGHLAEDFDMKERSPSQRKAAYWCMSLLTLSFLFTVASLIYFECGVLGKSLFCLLTGAGVFFLSLTYVNRWMNNPKSGRHLHTMPPDSTPQQAEAPQLPASASPTLLSVAAPTWAEVSESFHPRPEFILQEIIAGIVQDDQPPQNASGSSPRTSGEALPISQTRPGFTLDQIIQGMVQDAKLPPHPNHNHTQQVPVQGVQIFLGDISPWELQRVLTGMAPDYQQAPPTFNDAPNQPLRARPYVVALDDSTPPLLTPTSEGNPGGQPPHGAHQSHSATFPEPPSRNQTSERPNTEPVQRMMNRKEMSVLWTGMILAALVLLFPPHSEHLYWGRSWVYDKHQTSALLTVIAMFTIGGIFTMRQQK